MIRYLPNWNTLDNSRPKFDSLNCGLCVKLKLSNEGEIYNGILRSDSFEHRVHKILKITANLWYRHRGSFKALFRTMHTTHWFILFIYCCFALKFSEYIYFVSRNQHMNEADKLGYAHKFICVRMFSIDAIMRVELNWNETELYSFEWLVKPNKTNRDREITVDGCVHEMLLLPWYDGGNNNCCSFLLLLLLLKLVCEILVIDFSILVERHFRHDNYCPRFRNAIPFTFCHL